MSAPGTVCVARGVKCVVADKVVSEREVVCVSIAGSIRARVGRLASVRWVVYILDQHVFFRA